ncbi:PQQ-dependent sugar dehydrogenase [Sandarakinorhabdus rubra]|uniref:PQQ-dependent sugar dehydrogenase n=1 Tax=Sandarakinorhabdus rubra TaxID=2672568 RepID=UPI001F206910|nr:PQQ-dependent sugar dehydrogenase [Sandarakinorhabdus rubra]
MKKLLITLALVATATEAARAETVETIASGLDHPWSIAFLPGGEGVLVTERSGRLLRIAGGGGTPMAIAGVPAAYVKSQGGLFDVALHPRFAENRLLYLSMSAGSAKANFTRIVRARLDGNRLADVQTIFEVKPAKDTPVHFGGRMAFLPDGSLVMTTGDGFDYRERAQALNSGLGKIVRMNSDGRPLAGNPYVGRADAWAYVWSLGHRNPQGLAVDPATGRLWALEHGPRGGDELNLIEKGGNYGWPVATFGMDYSGATISPFKRYKGMIDARRVWVPSIAPSGLAVYRGPLWLGWQGDLIVGALVNKEVRRIDLDASGKVVGEERIFPKVSARIRDVRVAPDGAVWLTTDEDQGRVLRVTP